MVDVGVGEAEGAEAGGPKREVLVVELPLLLRPLKHSAIDQDAGCFRLEQEAGARHGSGGAVEVKAKRQGNLLDARTHQLEECAPWYTLVEPLGLIHAKPAETAHHDLARSVIQRHLPHHRQDLPPEGRSPRRSLTSGSRREDPAGSPGSGCSTAVSAGRRSTTTAYCYVEELLRQERGELTKLDKRGRPQPCRRQPWSRPMSRRTMTSAARSASGLSDGLATFGGSWPFLISLRPRAWRLDHHQCRTRARRPSILIPTSC